MSYWTTRGHLKSILLSERSQSEKATDFGLFTTWHSRKDKTVETVGSSGLPEVGEKKGWTGGTQMILREVKILYKILQWYICHFTVVQTHRKYNTKNEPWCKPWP